MAKTSSIEKNKRRRKMAEQQAPKRKRLKDARQRPDEDARKSASRPG